MWNCIHMLFLRSARLFFLLVVADFSAFWSTDIYVILQAESSSGSQEQVNPLIWISSQVEFLSVIAQEMAQLCSICFLRSLLGRLLSCMTNIWHMWPTVLQITLSFTRYIQVFTVVWLFIFTLNNLSFYFWCLNFWTFVGFERGIWGLL